MKIKKNDKLFKSMLTINAFLVLLIFSTTNVFADFYVIAGSRGVGTKITSLPYTIASSGFYFIDKDLSISTATGITITADDVTLDLMGFSLDGSGGTGSYHGIYMNSRANVEIRNGTVKNFNSRGIYEDSTNGTGHRIINIRVKGNQSFGISLSSKNNLIKGCSSIKNGSTGIYTGTGSTATGNTCYDNDVNGIYLGRGTTATDNICYANFEEGIVADHGCTVTNNTCYLHTEGTVSAGIELARGCTATNNTCYDNKYGINADMGCTIIGNTCYSNSAYGIHRGNYSYVDQNTVYDNLNDINDCGIGCLGTNVGDP